MTINELWGKTLRMPRAYRKEWVHLRDLQTTPERTAICESALLACRADHEFSAAACDPQVKNKHLASAANHKRYTLRQADNKITALYEST